jgi:hypothetical protein
MQNNPAKNERLGRIVFFMISGRGKELANDHLMATFFNLTLKRRARKLTKGFANASAPFEAIFFFARAAAAVVAVIYYDFFNLPGVVWAAISAVVVT